MLPISDGSSMDLRSTSVCLALGLAGCTAEAPPAPTPAFVLSGCAAVEPGPICVNPSQVRIWLPVAPTAVDGPSVAADAGARLNLPAAQTIKIRGHMPIHVAFETRSASSGRVRHREGRDAHRANRTADAIAILQSAAAAQAQANDRSGAALSAQLLAFIHRAHGDLSAARAVLDTWQPPKTDGAARAMHAYFRGLVALAGADPRGALIAFDDAARWAQRLDLPLMSVVQQQRALTWSNLGRSTDAIATLEACVNALDAAASACARADVLTNLGWVRLQSEQATAARTGAVLARADELYGECATAPEASVANVRLNRGLWALRAGDRPLAMRMLATIGTPTDTAVAAWTAYLRARLSDDPDALTTVAERAEATALPGLAWRAWVDAAERSADQAIAHLQRAEALVAAGAFAVPADAGRIAFVEDRQASARALVAALIKAGRIDAAMDAARRARRRVLTTLPTSLAVARLDATQRARWEAAWSRWRAAQEALRQAASQDWGSARTAAPGRQAHRAALQTHARRALDAALSQLGGRAATSDALREPATDEVIVTGAPRPDGGWWVFARDARGTIVRSIDADWRAAIAEPLARARRIRLLSAGPIGTQDSASGAQTTVYALDLPPRPARPAATRATVIADPTGNLPQTRAEARRVHPALRTAIGPVTLIEAGAARRAAVLAAFGQAEHLHYAGHARHAGFEGWGSGLPVWDGTIALGDLLALPQAPRSVVLSGCRAGKAAGAQALGVGLAHALLVRGADWVIAPVRTVDDAVAAQVGEGIYRHRAAGLTWPQALQAAQEQAGATAWRLFVP